MSLSATYEVAHEKIPEFEFAELCVWHVSKSLQDLSKWEISTGKIDKYLKIMIEN